MGKTETLDPITIQVIRNALISCADEMRDTLVRTAFNPVIYELVDFCVDIFNSKAELIAEGKSAVMFMGTVSFAIKRITERVGMQNVEEGDVFISSYTYFTGSHSGDVLVFKPIFYDGEVFGYSASKAHWKDIGACHPLSTQSTDIYQEGLILPGVKVVRKGVLDKDIVDIIRYNSRLGDATIGDLRAQIACCETGEKRLLALINKYGKETLNEAIEAIIAHDETIMREAIAEIPDGEYYAEGGLDSNGLDDNPFKICVTVRVKGDEIVFDTTGSAPQQPGPTNCPYQTAVAICRLITKMIFEPHTRSSEGHWRPLTVITPEGSVFNPQPPAPTWLYGWVGGPLGECILKALAEVLPEKVVARSGGDICAGAYSYGINPRDGRWFAAGAGQGPVGQGASFDRDGGDALIHYNMSGSEAIPIEVFEERSPLRTECWSLRQNSGGPGKFRGGLGIERRVRALSDGWVDGVMEQTKYPAWGLFGGKSALPNIGILWPGTPKEKRFGKICHIPFLEGEVNCVLTGGGGGWGNPYERDVQAVLTDVIRGYVSLDSARKDYGVVIREEDGRYVLDEEGTDQLRKQKTEGA